MIAHTALPRQKIELCLADLPALAMPLHVHAGERRIAASGGPATYEQHATDWVHRCTIDIGFLLSESQVMVAKFRKVSRIVSLFIPLDHRAMP